MNKHTLIPKFLYYTVIALIGLVTLGWNPGMNSQPSLGVDPESFTASHTRTPKPTRTPHPTMTPCPRRDCKPAPSPTVTPSKTITSTVNPTPTPVCSIYASPLMVVNNQLTFNITNESVEVYIITTVYIDWPDTATQELTAIDLAGNVFWSGSEPTSPFLGTESDWIGPSSYREIPPFSDRAITFTFDESLPAFSYFIQITFTNGCTISLGN